MVSRKNKKNNARIKPERKKIAKEKETILMKTAYNGKTYLQKKK